MPCWCAGKCPHIAESVRLLNQRKLGQAEAILRRVLVENPGCGEAHKALAYALVENNHAYAAVAHIDKAGQLLGDLPAILADKASTYRNAMLMDDAIIAAERSATADPDNPRAWVALATAYHADHQIAEMGRTLSNAVARLGDHRELALVRAVYALEQRDPEKAVGLLNHGAQLGPLELYERGRAFEQLGRYGDAWSDWMAAKAMQQRQGYVWNRAVAESRYAMLMDSCRRRRFEGLNNAPSPYWPKPIFICGQPRSGTTMIEAILAAHPAIAGGDELMALPDTIQMIPAVLNIRLQYPAAIGALRLDDNRHGAEVLRDIYMVRALQKVVTQPAHVWFTDKMPSNELHLPLLWLLFPASPVIHTRRHPLDVVVSNMSNNLVHGGYISCSLEGFARNFALVAQLVDHYRENLPGLDLRTVPYESLAADLPAHLDQLLPPGLEPDRACLEFHKSAWRSRTISHRQIKEKIGTKSIGRYKPFLEYLKPVLGELSPVIERQGYVI